MKHLFAILILTIAVLASARAGLTIDDNDRAVLDGADVGTVDQAIASKAITPTAAIAALKARHTSAKAKVAAAEVAVRAAQAETSSAIVQKTAAVTDRAELAKAIGEALKVEDTDDKLAAVQRAKDLVDGDERAKKLAKAEADKEAAEAIIEKLEKEEPAKP